MNYYTCIRVIKIKSWISFLFNYVKIKVHGNDNSETRKKVIQIICNASDDIEKITRIK